MEANKALLFCETSLMQLVYGSMLLFCVDYHIPYIEVAETFLHRDIRWPLIVLYYMHTRIYSCFRAGRLLLTAELLKYREAKVGSD